MVYKLCNRMGNKKKRYLHVSPEVALQCGTELAGSTACGALVNATLHPRTIYQFDVFYGSCVTDILSFSGMFLCIKKVTHYPNFYGDCK